MKNKKLLIINSWMNSGGASRIILDFKKNNFDFDISVFGLIKKRILFLPYFINTYNKKITFAPYFNFILFKFFSRNIFTINPFTLKNAIKNSDIINLHVIHSYTFSECYLFYLIKKFNKPLVITLHDSWYFTGRCALPSLFNCVGYNKLCTSCIYKSSYPSTFIHHPSILKKRLSFFEDYKDKIIFISPSIWIYNIASSIFKNNRIVNIPNGINLEPLSIKKSELNFDFIFVTNDFNESFKFSTTDFDLIKNKFSDNSFCIVGDNPPKMDFDNLVILSKQNHDSLMQLLNQSKSLLFFSVIDNYPTILIESLCNGLYIICHDSAGTKEVLNKFQYFIDYIFISDLLKLETNLILSFVNDNNTHEKRKSKARLSFGMSNYVKNYNESVRCIL
jgi:glycosyltransferase involved in cell wall biosynthesis